MSGSPDFADSLAGPRRSSARLLVLAAFLGLLAIGTAWLFYDRYARRDFNEEGRAYDPETHIVYVQQAGILWGGFTIVFAGSAAVLMAIALRSRNRVSP